MDGCLCPGDTGPGPGTLSPVPGQCPHPLVVTAGAHTLTTAQLCTCCHTDNTHTTSYHFYRYYIDFKIILVLLLLFTEHLCASLCVV